MISLAKRTILWTIGLTIACVIDFKKTTDTYKKKKKKV